MRIGFFASTQSVASRLVLAAGTAFAMSNIAQAQTWTGGSAVDSNWTTAANWSSLPLNNGTANIIFGGVTRLTPAVNVAQDVNGITFNNTAGAFSIGGAGMLTIRAGGIINNDTQLQTISSSITLASAQIWNSAAGPITIGGSTNVTMNASLALNTNFTITQSVGSTGIGGLTKNGTGIFALGGTLGHTGPTIINAGSISALINNALPSFSDLTINAPGTLELNGNSGTVERLQGNGTVNLGAGTLVVTSDPDISNYTFSGSITGSGGYTKAGTFSHTLAGVNTYTGTTWVNNGTLKIAASERLDNASDLLITGGMLDVQSFTETLDQVTVNTGGTITGTGTIIANSFTIQGGNVYARFAGPAALTKSNNATNSVFNGTGSSYSGGTNITGGTLVTNALDVLPDSTIVAVTSPGVLQVTNFSDTVAGITGNGIIAILSTTLTVGAGDVSSNFSGIINDSATSGNLTKIGQGILTLSGVNTYRGTTTVNQGTLILDGTERLDNASDVVVNGGQFVVQNETIDRCTLNGGEIRAFSTGNGILRASQFTLNAGYVDASLGGAGIVKAGPGTVLLAAANDQTFTRIDAGVLQAGSDAVFGGSSANISLNGGTLQLTAPMILTRPFNVFSPSTLDCLGDVILTNLSPNISLGGLTKTGPGILSISGTPASAGAALNISGGSVYIGPTQSLPMINVSITDAGTLAIDGGLLRLTTSLSNLGHIQLSDTARITGGSLVNSGAISGSGTIASTFTNNAAGDVRIGADQSMYFNSFGATNNAGLLEVIGGMAEFEGAVTNFASTGLLFARDASLRFNAGLTNFGGIALSFGITDFFGEIDNRAGGVITISGGSDATFLDDVINNGTLRTSAGGNSVFLGTVSGSGSFPGSGVVYLEGDLRPGNSPGLVTFGGDVVFGSFSSLVEEIAGTNLNQFDRTAITGTAYLDGTLDVRFISGYTPSGIQSFTILTAGNVSGRFQSVNLPPATPPLRVIYTDTAVLVSNCAADFNNDAVVDFFDYLDFVAAFAANLPESDFNQDSVIDFFDYLDFVQAFSAGC